MQPTTRPTTYLVGLFIVASLACPAIGQPANQHLPTRGIFSASPAKIWQEAMLSGNGTMGAMVFGNPVDERIVLNHERLYEPLLDSPCPVPKVAGALDKTRELYLAGKYQEAYQYYYNACKQAGFPGIQWTDPYHPACALTIKCSALKPSDRYTRSTNFFTGEVTVRCPSQQIRQTFVSRSDDVIVHRIVSVGESNDAAGCLIRLVNQDSRPKSKRVDKFGGGYREPIIETKNGWITYRCKYERSQRGYVVVLRSISDGTATPIATRSSNALSAKPGDTMLLIDIRPLEDFALADSAVSAAQKKLAAMEADYDSLLNRHASIHREMFQRVEFLVEGAGDRQSQLVATETLIANQRANVDTQLNALMLQKMFEMGRYTLISSSGEWPPNLMGIWNGEWRPKWSGDFTLDANVNLQIAAANIGNLPEAIESYDRLIQRLLPDWRTNAMNLYGCRGVLSGSRTDGRHNLHTHFSSGFPGCSWVSGAQWLVLPMFEHYQTTGDKEYLRKKLLPVMKEIALFYEDYLANTEDQHGKKMFVPSYSPENKPLNADHASVVNATMDIACCKEVLTQLLNLGAEADLNADQRKKYQALLDKLPNYLTNQDGALKEWTHSDLQDRYDHRHVSHLYPVWPGHEINPEDTPKLFKAATIAAAKKGRGNGSAHGLAHMALIGARLRDANLVEGNLRFMMGSGFVLPSLATYHNIGEIYNLDMLNSLPAVVLEMLVYSKPGEIELLPALPPSLSAGRITGVACRNQCIVKELTWDLNKRTVSLTVESKINQTINLRVRKGIDYEATNDFANGTISRIDSNTVALELTEGQVMTQVLQLKASARSLKN